MVAVDPVSVKLGGQTFVFDATTMIVKTLFETTLTTTGISFHDETGGNYQVPTGKKFIALEYFTSICDTAKTLTLYSSTAADGTTGEVDKLFLNYENDAPTDTFNINISFAADLFVTAKVSTANGTEPAPVVVGIEMDA